MRYARMYADESGESHFEDIDVAMAPGSIPPPAIPANRSEPMAAGAIRFLEFPPGLNVNHPAPTRQFFIVLSGEVRVTTSDGESRTFAAGDVGLAEDTTGKGHETVCAGTASAYLAITELQ
jgi:hypothetical protein